MTMEVEIFVDMGLVLTWKDSRSFLLVVIFRVLGGLDKWTRKR